MQNQSQNNDLSQIETTVWNTWMTTVNGGEQYIESDQDYEAILVGAVTNTSSNSGRPMVDVEYRLLDGGQKIHTYYMLDTPKGVSHLKRWAKILGCRLPNDPRHLTECLNRTVSERAKVLIRVLDNNGFLFALILKRMDPEDGSGSFDKLGTNQAPPTCDQSAIPCGQFLERSELVL